LLYPCYQDKTLPYPYGKPRGIFNNDAGFKYNKDGSILAVVLMKRYEQIDMSGDVGLRIWGEGLNELFENAGAGMSELITDTSVIKEHINKDVEIMSDSTESLLVQWLNELIYLFDVDGFIGKIFRVRIENNVLRAHVKGDNFNNEINERRLLLKAATYHNLSLKSNDHWEAFVIFDI